MNQGYLGPFCDHLDMRVRNLAQARTFYDPFCAALGLTTIHVDEKWISYGAPDLTLPFLAIDADPQFVAGSSRIALRGSSRIDVDRISDVARVSGARQYEPPHVCPEYSAGYYASFFEDPDGNRYEICHRPLTPTIARLWRSRVKAERLNEYRDYVRETGLRDYRNVAGNRGACILSADQDGTASIITLSFWDSFESIARFAGDDVTRARYYPADDDYLIDRPTEVEHFDVMF
jgi:catechol 2,3-dioxygenase-like lactoylglutathione lyase family enzyme